MKNQIKKITIILIVMLFMMSLAGTALAEGDCNCEVTGAEKNKHVSNMLKSDNFKKVRHELKEMGYPLQGVSNAEVEHNEYVGIIIAIPYSVHGETVVLLTLAGEYKLINMTTSTLIRNFNDLF